MSATFDKQKFDSRTYVKPKRRTPRPSLQTMVESPAPHVAIPSKYLTYNKYNPPLGISPMLRLKTFNVDANSTNGDAFKDYSAKRKSFMQDDSEDPQV